MLLKKSKILERLDSQKKNTKILWAHFQYKYKNIFIKPHGIMVVTLAKVILKFGNNQMNIYYWNALL